MDKLNNKCKSLSTLFSSSARARSASLASKDSRTDTDCSLAFSAYALRRFSLPGFSACTGSPLTTSNLDSAASSSFFATRADSSADITLFLIEEISFLRSDIRL